MKDKHIKREHGYGGEKTRELIEKIILPEISNPYADQLDDSAVLPFPEDTVIFTADSFVVSPVFFPGGDIGKLAVAGTVNDILAQGGRPLYISMALILEEGFKIEDLRSISRSAADESKKAGVKIVCGDIKVVEKGKGDGVYISTSGIGERIFTMDKADIKEGDAIIIAGAAGEHGAAIFQARNKLLEESKNIKSDCGSLVDLMEVFKKFGDKIKFMRDPTRGGVAEVMLELAGELKRKITIEEQKIPVKDWVKGLAYIAGLDYLYLACEGNMIFAADGNCAEEVAEYLKNSGFKDTKIIGKIGKKTEHLSAVLNTFSGGSRYLTSADIVQIPRIC